MKYVVIVVVSMLAVMSTVAQNRFSSVSESQLNEIRVSNQVGNPNVSVVAIINSAFDSETLEAKGITVRTLRGSIATLNVPLSEIDFIEKSMFRLKRKKQPEKNLVSRKQILFFHKIVLILKAIKFREELGLLTWINPIQS